VRIDFTGGQEDFRMFIEALEDEGLAVDYERPRERATGGRIIVHAVLWLLDNAASAAVGVAVGAGYERARAKVQARFPRTRIEAQETQEADDPTAE
jgi:hypothetical protein